MPVRSTIIAISLLSVLASCTAPTPVRVAEKFEELKRTPQATQNVQRPSLSPVAPLAAIDQVEVATVGLKLRQMTDSQLLNWVGEAQGRRVGAIEELAVLADFYTEFDDGDSGVTRETGECGLFVMLPQDRASMYIKKLGQTVAWFGQDADICWSITKEHGGKAGAMVAPRWGELPSDVYIPLHEYSLGDWATLLGLYDLEDGLWRMKQRSDETATLWTRRAGFDVWVNISLPDSIPRMVTLTTGEQQQEVWSAELGAYQSIEDGGEGGTLIPWRIEMRSPSGNFLRVSVYDATDRADTGRRVSPRIFNVDEVMKMMRVPPENLVRYR